MVYSFSLRMAVVMLILTLTIGCASVENSWKAAQLDDSIMAYENFQKQYPKSAYVEKAISRIEELNWQNVQSIDSVTEYETFLERYPKSKYTDLAQAKIEEQQWQYTQSIDTIMAYKDFITRHPNSKYTQQAKTKIIRIRQELFRSAKSFGIRIKSDSNVKFIIPLIENLANRYLLSTGSHEIVDANLATCTLEIITTGNSISEIYNYKNKSYNLYTGAVISGTISLRTSDISITKYFKGKNNPPSFFELGKITLREEVSLSKSYDHSRKVLDDLDKIVANYSKPTEDIFINAFEDSSFYSAMSDIIAEAFGQSALLSLIYDENVEISRPAIGTLGEIGDSRAVGPLIEILGNMESHNQYFAKDALVNLGEIAVESLVTASQDNDYKALELALATLVDIGEPAVDPLISLLEIEKTWRRVSIAEALSEIGDERSVEPLIAALNNENADITYKVADAYIKLWERLGRPPVDPIIDNLRAWIDGAYPNSAAPYILSKIGKPALLPVTNLLEDENRQIRLWAVRIIYEMAEWDNFLKSDVYYDCVIALTNASRDNNDIEVRRFSGEALKALTK